MQGVSKRFGGVRALEDADLVIEAGRIHAVLGENGAGKSTLMNILYGFYQADGGAIRVGAAIVRDLAARGYQVAIHANTSLDRAQELRASGQTIRQIAEQLNAEGFHTPTGRGRIKGPMVNQLLQRHVVARRGCRTSHAPPRA